MKLSERKLCGKTVYDGKILKLEVDTVELPDGATAQSECVRHSGGAADFARRPVCSPRLYKYV